MKITIFRRWEFEFFSLQEKFDLEQPFWEEAITWSVLVLLVLIKTIWHNPNRLLFIAITSKTAVSKLDKVAIHKHEIRHSEIEVDRRLQIRWWQLVDDFEKFMRVKNRHKQASF